MELKINLSNQLKMLPDLIFVSSIYFFIIYFCYESLVFKFLFLLSIPYFLIYFLPVLFLHLNYLNENKGVVYVIDNNFIFRKKDRTNIKYKIDYVSEIVIYKNGARETKVGVLAHKEYFYAKIKFLDGTNFIITSLCSNKIDKILEKNFKDVKITIEKVFYPMI